jgi:hypothetical protein
VSGSYGVSGSDGVKNALFAANLMQKPTIFNNVVEKEYFEMVMFTLNKKLGSWKPTFNNIKALYLKHGSQWKKTPINLAKEIQKEDAWADMPKEAEDYIRSLPEFDAKIFKEVTGKE